MTNVAVIGLGKVGSLVGTLLSDLFTVTGLDQKLPYTELPFAVETGSVSDATFLDRFYRLSPERAANFIFKQMQSLLSR